MLLWNIKICTRTKITDNFGDKALEKDALLYFAIPLCSTIMTIDMKKISMVDA